MSKVEKLLDAFIQLHYSLRQIGIDPNNVRVCLPKKDAYDLIGCIIYGIKIIDIPINDDPFMIQTVYGNYKITPCCARCSENLQMILKDDRKTLRFYCHSCNQEPKSKRI